jgi:hypothetical protein
MEKKKRQQLHLVAVLARRNSSRGLFFLYNVGISSISRCDLFDGVSGVMWQARIG